MGFIQPHLVPTNHATLNPDSTAVSWLSCWNQPTFYRLPKVQHRSPRHNARIQMYRASTFLQQHFNQIPFSTWLALWLPTLIIWRCSMRCAAVSRGASSGSYVTWVIISGQLWSSLQLASTCPPLPLPLQVILVNIFPLWKATQATSLIYHHLFSLLTHSVALRENYRSKGSGRLVISADTM